MSKPTIRQRCREGNIPIQEFIDFVSFKPALRTHFLDVGDYVVSAPLTRCGLDLKRVTELDYLGENDFRAVRDATGPISGNLFVKLKEGGGYEIIEGDSLYTGPGSVTHAVRSWQEMIGAPSN